MRLHFIQHVPFEGPAAIAEWADARGASISIRHVYRGEALPKGPEFDGLVVLGGPMSVNDEAELAWLRTEKALVRATLEAGKPMLGVCLGAQMIASALGARVYRAAEREIGWFPVQLSESVGRSGFSTTLVPLHWHGETFDLPPGAELLASTAAVPNQAFRIGEKVLGLQFHIEATETSLDAMIEHCADEIGQGLFQQQPHIMKAEAPARVASLRPVLEAVLDGLFR